MDHGNVDDDPQYFTGTVFGHMAENVEKSLHKRDESNYCWKIKLFFLGR